MKFTLPLSDMDLSDLPSEDRLSHSFEIRSCVKTFVVSASTSSEKSAWMDAITNARIELVKNSATLKLQGVSQGRTPTGASRVGAIAK